MEKLVRSYHIGSEWVYYKIYTGPKTADVLLTDLIQPVVEELIKNEAISNWFFIRYADPNFHLRLRFKVVDLNYIGTVVNTFNKMASDFLKDDLIWNIQLDTYRPEMERYGDITMPYAEHIFRLDSEMIVNFLNLIDDSVEGEELRWLFGFRAVASILDDFELDEAQQLFIIEQLKISFCAEFNMNKALKKQLDKKFIAYKDTIANFMTLQEDNENELSELIKIINHKSHRSVPYIKDIKGHIKTSELNPMIGSMIHMTMNRLFRFKNRLYEMVIYYFLLKHYKMVIGRRTYKSELTTP